MYLRVAARTESVHISEVLRTAFSRCWRGIGQNDNKQVFVETWEEQYVHFLNLNWIRAYLPYLALRGSDMRDRSIELNS